MGKLYKSNHLADDYDPNNPSIEKSTAFNTGAGWGLTYRCVDIDELAKILELVGADPHMALVLGFVDGTQPADNLEHGEPYRLISKKELVALLPDKDPKKVLAKPQLLDFDGQKVLHATRSVEMFSQTTWFAFDLDMSPDMPNELRELIANNEYIDMLKELCPQLADTSYLSVTSASSRVRLSGAPLAAENAHLYMQGKFPQDFQRFAASMLVRSLPTPYGYVNPARDIETNEIDPRRNGAPASIFDRSVFSKARVMFEGSPRVDETDPHVINGELTLHPPVIVKHHLANKFVDTMGYLSPDKVQQESAKMIFGKTGKGFQVSNHTDLVPSTKIEVKDLDGQNERVITMREFVEGDDDRLRAQNPFKPTSTSWSSFLSKVDSDDKPITPFLHSNEFGNFIYSDTKEKFAESMEQEPIRTNVLDSPALETFVAPPPPSDVPSPVPAPPPPDAAQLTIPTVDHKPKQLVGYDFTSGRDIPIYPLPSELDDDELAGMFVDRYFGDGGANLLVAAGGKALHNWVGDHWEKIEPDMLKTIAFMCASEGGVKRLNSNKINSVYNCSLMYARRTSTAEPLPTHMIPMSNGLLDFTTGTLIPHTRDYFYTSCKDFPYDPNEKGEGVLQKIIQDASCGDPLFEQQFKEMAGYLVAGGDNIAHKIMYFDGVSRSGKSTAVQTIIALVHSTLNFEIGEIASPKILKNIPNKAMLIDEDAQTPPLQQRTAVTGTIKKITGGAWFDIQQLYTPELFNAFLHPKVAIACNGIPMLPDPSGAIHDRGLIIRFDKSHRGKEDMSLGQRLAQPKELSASMNYVIEGYQSLLANNGFDSIEAFEKSNQKKLNFTMCNSAIEAEEESLAQAQPMHIFFKDCCEYRDDYQTSFHQLERRIRMWAEHQPGLEFLKRYGRNAFQREIRNMALRKGLELGRFREGGRTLHGVVGIRVKFDVNE